MFPGGRLTVHRPTVWVRRLTVRRLTVRQAREKDVRRQDQQAPAQQLLYKRTGIPPVILRQCRRAIGMDHQDRAAGSVRRAEFGEGDPVAAAPAIR